ncbi:hypothetical protein B0T26DRAFT_703543 [Lasiosphaeria miniovina]|uniref:Uncharacterized protein n=1 Tax=Lasiosphaeria miniovina TaxID=1954250 RepID=A0AA40E2L4_9PEZI|nr:uncharacterized protein B0T26DRAFT_703543 [Lasiosphaeria miniovina]KAK0722662.1 hypothetical protein B0T26DRAFT_703543 [Lasiosphaeria miniovina]
MSDEDFLHNSNEAIISTDFETLIKRVSREHNDIMAKCKEERREDAIALASEHARDSWTVGEKAAAIDAAAHHDPQMVQISNHGAWRESKRALEVIFPIVKKYASYREARKAGAYVVWPRIDQVKAVYLMCEGTLRVAYSTALDAAKLNAMLDDNGRRKYDKWWDEKWQLEDITAIDKGSYKPDEPHTLSMKERSPKPVLLQIEKVLTTSKKTELSPLFGTKPSPLFTPPDRQVTKNPTPPKNPLFMPPPKKRVTIASEDGMIGYQKKPRAHDEDGKGTINRLENEIRDLKKRADEEEEERRQLSDEIRSIKDEMAKQKKNTEHLKILGEKLLLRANSLSASLTNITLLGHANAVDPQQLLSEIGQAIERGRNDDFDYQEYEASLQRYEWKVPEESTNWMIPYKVENEEGADEAIVRADKLFVIPTIGPLQGREVFIGNLNDLPKENAQKLGLIKVDGHWTKNN